MSDSLDILSYFVPKKNQGRIKNSSLLSYPRQVTYQSAPKSEG